MSPASPVLSPVKVSAAWDETEWLRGLTIDAPPESRAAHTSPGQYLKVSVLGLEGYLALANAPGRPLELLVKRGSALGDATAGLAVGAEIAASPPMGKGYPLAAHRGRDVHLFAAGSGIAPIRAVVEAVRADRAAWGKVSLWDGQRSSAHVAYQADRAAWRQDGIAVEECLSAPEDAWPGARGHAHDVFAAQPAALSADAVVYVCGMKGLIEGLKGVLATHGVGPERVFQNY